MSISSKIIEVISDPEFWTSIAFIGVVLIAIKPLATYLKKWGQAQAAQIKNKIDETADLKQKAFDLFQKYEIHTKNVKQEKAAITKEAETEISILQKQSEEDLKERLTYKTQAVQQRLQTMRKNAEQKSKEKILTALLSKTYDILEKNKETFQTKAEADKSLNMIYAVLEEHAPDLRHP